MKKSYSTTQDFVDDLHKESVRELLIVMGYLLEEDFVGSKISCPFHGTDKTPSMQVTDGFFKCYSCNAKGDIIKWIELADSLNFVESVNHIANNLQIELKTSNFSEYAKMKAALEKEWGLYKSQLNDMLAINNDFSAYLKAMIKDYFPQEVGLDKRTGYLVLPFTSKTGSVLGFTKRRIDYKERSGPKWVHSNLDNSLIKYCSNIFNLGRANKHISESKTVHLVEGPKDVAGMERAMFLNTASICGTSNISENVLNTLCTIEKIVLIMDGDDAGRKALISAVIAVSKFNSKIVENIDIVILPEKEDPGSLDKEELTRLVNDPVNGLHWFVNNAPDEKIAELVDSSGSSIIRSVVVRLLNNRFGYTSSESEEWLNSRIKSKSAFNRSANKTKDDMKERLLATIGKSDDINVEPLNMSEDHAKKILQLRYNYK